jgi:ribosome-binding protein aMBF1 (putative translation factor)
MNETYGCYICGDVLTNGSQTVVVYGGVANAKVEVCKKCLDEHHQHFFLEGEDLDNERRRFGFNPDKPYWDGGKP